MTLYIIGIGLWDEKDITVKGLEAVKKCDRVFLENYTSKLGVSVDKVEAFYGKKIILADRELVEKRADEIILPAKDSAVAFLVIGDAFGATTHTDIFLRAREKGVHVSVIHNASVMNAIGVTGLELYKFGKTTSIPFHNENVEAPYDAIKANRSLGLHTLVLLDIQKDNHSEKYMRVNEAVNYLMRIEGKRKEKIFDEATLCLGVARLGSKDMRIIAGTPGKLLLANFGDPLHCLIIPGKLHFIEEEALSKFQ
jgi:diphthine methyl ester synthase